MDLTSCWDDQLLYDNRHEIITVSRACSGCHEYCCRFLNAANSLASDSYRMALDCVNTDKLAGYCARLSAKEIKAKGGKTGTEKVRFLSAVTNKGVYIFTDTVKKLAQKIYLINDDYGAVSRLMLFSMRSNALKCGYDVISCYCPLSPYERLEHLFIPELGLGFMTSNRMHDFSLSIEPYRIINSQRFVNAEKIKSHKKRFSFNRKAEAQMVDQAAKLIADAKRLHDELESYYITATDFSKVDKLSKQLLQKMKSL